MYVVYDTKKKLFLSKKGKSNNPKRAITYSKYMRAFQIARRYKYYKVLDYEEAKITETDKSIKEKPYQENNPVFYTFGVCNVKKRKEK